MNRQLQWVLIVLPLALSSLSAQEAPPQPPIALSGQLRLRTELDGTGLVRNEPTLMYLLRSQLRATSRPIAGVTVLLELQDSRFFGSGDPAMGRGTADGSADGFDMHQANVLVQGLLDLPVDLRLGRQEMSFNNERILGASGWNNTPRAFDGARATVRATDVQIDLFGARLTASAPSPTASQNLYGLWWAYRPSTSMQAELYGMRDDNTNRIRAGEDSGSAILERYHLGTYLKATVGPLECEVEGIGQTGQAARNDSTSRRDIRAFMLSANAWIMIDDRTKTKLQALATVLSGDGSSGDTIAEAFNTLFGTNHRPYGTMDLLPTLAGDFGLVDLSGAIQSVPVKGLRMLLEGHLFLPQRNGGDENFGTEIDLTLWWKSVSAFELSGGASAFMPAELVKSRVGEKPRFWMYVAGTWQF